MLINEITMNIVTLIIMLYNLSEKNKFEKKKSNLNRSRMLLKKYEFEKNYKKFQIKVFTVLSNFITRIVKIYFDDIIFQRIIQIKKLKIVVFQSILPAKNIE